MLGGRNWTPNRVFFLVICRWKLEAREDLESSLALFKKGPSLPSNPIIPITIHRRKEVQLPPFLFWDFH